MFFLSFSAFANDLQNINSFQASFEQIIINSSNKEIVYKGDVFIKKEGKVLWQYKEPVLKNVFVIKNVAIIDEPELEQVIYTQLQNDINMISLIKNAKKHRENLYVTRVNNIDYELRIENKNLKEVVYKDTLENSVKIVFNNIKQNENISDELFQFFPPDHYDIIRQ